MDKKIRIEIRPYDLSFPFPEGTTESVDLTVDEIYFNLPKLENKLRENFLIYSDVNNFDEIIYDIIIYGLLHECGLVFHTKENSLTKIKSNIEHIINNCYE